MNFVYGDMRKVHAGVNIAFGSISCLNIGVAEAVEVLEYHSIQSSSVGEVSVPPEDEHFVLGLYVVLDQKEACSTSVVRVRPHKAHTPFRF